MKPESVGLSASARALRRTLWEEVKRLLLPRLRRRLHFADAEAVLGLIEKQFNHTRFLPEALAALGSEQPADRAAREAWLQAKARALCDGVVAASLGTEGESGTAVAYVADCERVAEYLDPKTGPSRQEEIRGYYWHAYQAWVANRLREMFQERSPNLSANDPRLEQAQHWVEDRIFGETRFRKTLAAYHPAEGKSFTRFLEFPLIGRCCDARDRFGAEPETCALPEVVPIEGSADDPADAGNGMSDPEELLVRATSVTELDSVEPAAERLRRCLAALRRPEERAVIELRYRAHVNPKFMASWTLSRAARVTNRRHLESEYEQDQQALQMLQEEEIPERESEHRQAYALRERRQAELEVQGWSAVQISGLKQQRAATIERLETALKHPAIPNSRRAELEFLIACVRHRLATNRLLEARDRLARYRGAQHPWVRSQEQIAQLLGFDQVTVSNRLKQALRAMRAWNVTDTHVCEGGTARHE